MNPTADKKKFPTPQFSPEMQQGLKDYLEVSEKHYEVLNKDMLALCDRIPDLAALIKGMPKELMDKQNAENRERTRKAILEGEWQPYFSHSFKEGVTYAQMGISFGAWFELVKGIRTLMSKYLIKAYAPDLKRLLLAIDGMNEIMDLGMAVIGQAYLTTKEETISKQQESIRELSTPVLKARDRFLILPIVGIIDTQRARQITEDLLRSVRNNRAKVVVMDITGVPIVDSKVANHFVQTVEAARLMGATVIITGLSPEIAQTLVALGAELSNVRTFGDLQGGIEEAQGLLGLRVVEDGIKVGASLPAPEAEHS